jgi:hypothetical protein
MTDIKQAAENPARLFYCHAGENRNPDFSMA